VRGGSTLNTQLLHSAAQGAGIEVQNFRCATLAFDHPVCLRQHGLDVAALDIFERAPRLSRCGRGEETLIGLAVELRASILVVCFDTVAPTVT
jgi:hypothetical protein